MWRCTTVRRLIGRQFGDIRLVQHQIFFALVPLVNSHLVVETFQMDTVVSASLMKLDQLGVVLSEIVVVEHKLGGFGLQVDFV